MFSDVSVGGAFHPVSLNSECKSLKRLCLWQKVKPSCRYSSVKDGVKMHRRRCDMPSSAMAKFCEADEHLSGRMWEKQFDTFPRSSVKTLLCICLRINKSCKASSPVKHLGNTTQSSNKSSLCFHLHVSVFSAILSPTSALTGPSVVPSTHYVSTVSM